jgi:hypothetical protein
VNKAISAHKLLTPSVRLSCCIIMQQYHLQRKR